jgi:hypothetical protein
MKKLFPLLILLLVPLLNIYPQNKVIKVSSVTEFLSAVGPDRTIKVESGIYDFSTCPQDTNGEYYYLDNVYDGSELVLTNIKNMKIIGTGFSTPKFITEPVYGNVISFTGCSNIFIENFEMGHKPLTGGCTGGVLKFETSNDITINDCILYGCGTEGITCDAVSGLVCNNTVIRNCSYGIMSLGNSNSINFRKCDFIANKEFDMVNILDCTNIKFSKCYFSNNKSTTEYDYSDYSLFNIEGQEQVVLNDCEIINNSTNYFCTNKNLIKLVDTPIEKNNFTKALYKEIQKN